MITIKSLQEIEILRKGGRLLANIRDALAEMAQPGVSAKDLDRRAERLIFDAGGTPSFRGYRGKRNEKPYPASICVSVNNELVHAPPRKKVIFQKGDVVGIDVGMWWPKKEIGNWKLEIGKKNQLDLSNLQPPTSNLPMLCTDTAVTVGVGKISKDAERLLRGTQEALDIGIQAVRPGAHIGDIGCAIEAHLKKYNLGIVRKLAGHGVGYAVHEEPFIPNYGKQGTGVVLKKGMVIAIEPMATLGGDDITVADDEWTIVSCDGSLAAHFEHTVAVTESGGEVLTARNHVHDQNMR